MADMSIARGTFAVTPISAGRTIFGNKRVVIADVTVGDGTDTFPVGGVSLTPANFGLKGIDFVSFTQGKVVYTFDYTNNLFLAYTAAGSPGATATLIAFGGATGSFQDSIRVTVYGYGVA
jgi:hypothetical protein